MLSLDKTVSYLGNIFLGGAAGGTFRGTVSKVYDTDTCYSVNYQEDGGMTFGFAVMKKETSLGDFIKAAQGKRVEVEVDSVGFVTKATIDNTIVIPGVIPR